MTTKQEVLQNCTVEGNIVKLPNVQLDRKLYQDVAKALELIGGKWKGGKVFGFVFNSDPTELLEQIANGENRNLKKEYQFFATPDALADKLVTLANLLPQDTILEPSAGQGAIVEAIRRSGFSGLIHCIELMTTNSIILCNKRITHDCADFLSFPLKPIYSKIIANPPFSNNQDIDHLYKMYSCLADSGRLVCITSESWVKGTQKKQVEFRNWLVNVGATVIEIEKGAFKESGTLVGGRIIVIQKSLK
jgi:hypothetical protein